MVRTHQSKDFGQPTIQDVIKAMKFMNVAETNYGKDPTKVSSSKAGEVVEYEYEYC
jgi:hypothetical protein|tara:strand:+ start:683 stop:850 length:168 start_codon:yes stop_codon:yes gene_type:complete